MDLIDPETDLLIALGGIGFIIGWFTAWLRKKTKWW